jgi:hypothetical protein
MEIVFAEHMDEVLPHALILDEGDSLFKKHDMAFDILPKDTDQDQPTHLI